MLPANPRYEEMLSLIPLWNYEVNGILFGKKWAPTCEECITACHAFQSERRLCQSYFPRSDVCANLPCIYFKEGGGHDRCSSHSCILSNFIAFQHPNEFLFEVRIND